MKYNYDLSVIVPGIRTGSWDTLFEHMQHACKRYSYELIFSGPYPLTDKLQKEKHVKYIKNFGSPTRAYHLGTLLAEGRFLTHIADDSHLYPDSIDASIDLLLANNPDKDIISMRYVESPGHSSQGFDLSYWQSATHPDLHAPGVNKDWKISLVPLMALARYHELGGVDCGYEHTNLNMIELGYRNYKDGYKVLLSTTQVQNCDFELDRTIESHPVIAAFHANDRPRFWSDWKDDSRSIKIDIENWRESDVIWKRRKF
jgi:hypothetical protein